MAKSEKASPVTSTGTKKIKLKTLNRYRVANSQTFERGQVYELPDDQADYLLETGQFEIAREPKKDKAPKRFPKKFNVDSKKTEAFEEVEDEDIEEGDDDSTFNEDDVDADDEDSDEFADDADEDDDDEEKEPAPKKTKKTKTKVVKKVSKKKSIKVK